MFFMVYFHFRSCHYESEVKNDLKHTFRFIDDTDEFPHVKLFKIIEHIWHVFDASAKIFQGKIYSPSWQVLIDYCPSGHKFAQKKRFSGKFPLKYIELLAIWANICGQKYVYYFIIIKTYIWGPLITKWLFYLQHKA